MGKIYTRFQTKTAQSPYPLGRHIFGSCKNFLALFLQLSFPHKIVSPTLTSDQLARLNSVSHRKKPQKKVADSKISGYVWTSQFCANVITLYSLPQTSFGVRLSRIQCVTNEPQRTSAGRLNFIVLYPYTKCSCKKTSNKLHQGVLTKIIFWVISSHAQH